MVVAAVLALIVVVTVWAVVVVLVVLLHNLALHVVRVEQILVAVVAEVHKPMVVMVEVLVLCLFATLIHSQTLQQLLV
jgi:hypothetical protein